MTTTSSSPRRATAPETVRFLDLAAAHEPLREQLEAAAARVIGSGSYLLGPELARFEAEFAAFVQARECVGVGSGLDALTLALRAAGVGPGDEVIVPGMTFVATWISVVHAGARPVPVDVEPATGLLDPQLAAGAIGPATRAIVPVHLYGHPADLDALGALAVEHGLALIDDAAQAHGARHRERAIGGITTATAWSFYPGKNLGALADAGAVTTDDAALAERVRSLRNYGSRQKYVHEDPGGMNSRLDELQAALLQVKLGRLDRWQQRRAEIAAAYDAALADSDLARPATADWARHAHHLYVVRSDERDAVRERLAQRGIETLVHYPIPPHRQRAFAGTAAARASLPSTDRWAASVLSLPIGPHLRDADVERVIDALRGW